MSRLLFTNDDGIMVLDDMGVQRYRALIKEHFPIAEFYRYLRHGQIEPQEMEDDLRFVEEADFSIDSMQRLLSKVSRERVLELHNRTIGFVLTDEDGHSSSSYRMLPDGRGFGRGVQAGHIFSMPLIHCRNCGVMEAPYLYWHKNMRFNLSCVSSAINWPLGTEENIRMNKCPHCSPASFTNTLSSSVWNEYAYSAGGGVRCQCDACNY